MLAKIKKNKNKKKKNGKNFDDLMFEYSNLGFLSIFKEFKSFLSSNIPTKCIGFQEKDKLHIRVTF